jgi:hypothetical protein
VTVAEVAEGGSLTRAVLVSPQSPLRSTEPIVGAVDAGTISSKLTLTVNARGSAVAGSVADTLILGENEAM